MKKLLNTTHYIDYTVYVDVTVPSFSELAASEVTHPKILRGKKYSDEELTKYNDSIDTILYSIPDELEILPESHQSNSSYSYYCICSLKDSPNAGKFRLIFRLSDHLKGDKVSTNRKSGVHTIVRNIHLDAGNMANDIKAQIDVDKYCQEFIKYTTQFKDD